ncbi:MAG: AraC family transcriptional regulator, partial [Pseudomonadota bacterium]
MTRRTDPYEARIRRVIRHIHDNPGGDLSLDALADIAAMSRFHWHRVFAAVTGETLATAARRIRLHHAAVSLTNSDRPVALIAADVGYPNPKSFARAFREVYGATPAQFRAAGRPPRAPAFRTAREETAMYDVQIEDHPARRAVALRHQGPYHEIGKAFEQISAIFTSRGLWPNALGMIGIYHDDPSLKAQEELLSHAGVVVAD